jgi:hypothetical protein
MFFIEFEHKMRENKIWIAFVSGFIAFGGQSLIGTAMPGSPFLQAIFGGLISFATGAWQGSARSFFGGIAVAMILWAVPGFIFGTSYDRYKIVIVGPLMIMWVLVVTALSFFAGNLAAMAFSRSKKNLPAKTEE